MKHHLSVAIFLSSLMLAACGKMEEPKHANMFDTQANYYSLEEYGKCTNKIDTSATVEHQQADQIACALKAKVTR